MKKSLFFFLLLAGVAVACLKQDLVTPAVQLRNDTTDIGNYLRSNNIHAIKIPQGVWYELDTPLLGAYPVPSDSVKVLFYVWKLPAAVSPLLSDTIQSSITSKSVTRTVLLSSVISGMQATLVRFPVGSHGRLYVPSGLAFGSTGSKAVPPNANLLYDVKLMSAAGSRLSADTVAVGTYIRSIAVELLLRGIKKFRDSPSGVWYSYSSLVPSNPTPTATGKVKVDLTTQILNASAVFHSVSDTTIDLSNTPVTAFKIVLPKITVGTTVTIYVPSGYGYGSLSPSTSIPPNSNLIYQVTLKSVSN